MPIDAPRIWLPQTGAVSIAIGDDGYFKAGNPRTTRFVDCGNGTARDLAHSGVQWIKQPEIIIPGCPAAGYSRSGTAVWTIQAARGDWATSTAYLAGDVVRDAAATQSTACNISAATAANPCVLTVDDVQGLTTGDLVLVAGIVGDMGTDVLNGNRYYVKVNATAKTLTLYTNSVMSTGANTTGKTYTSGGTATQCKFYVCTTDHTSGTFATDIAAGKWALSRWIASAASISPAVPRLMAWNEARLFSLGTAWSAVGGSLSFAGFTDWRLPNIDALQSLQNYADPAGAGRFFPQLSYQSASPFFYWSSTPYAKDTTQAFTSSFASAAVAAGSAYAMANPYYVRPVRGGRLNANWPT